MQLEKSKAQKVEKSKEKKNYFLAIRIFLVFLRLYRLTFLAILTFLFFCENEKLKKGQMQKEQYLSCPFYVLTFLVVFCVSLIFLCLTFLNHKDAQTRYQQAET